MPDFVILFNFSLFFDLSLCKQRDHRRIACLCLFKINWHVPFVVRRLCGSMENYCGFVAFVPAQVKI